MSRLSVAMLCVLMLAGRYGDARAQEAKREAGARRDVSLLNESRHSVRRGLQWLEGRQMQDGSWCKSSAITALVVTGFLGSKEPQFGPANPHVKKGLVFIAGKRNKDGSIGEGPQIVYSTSICLMALLAAKDPTYDETVRMARQYLLRAQADEGDGLDKDDSSYGGFGYQKGGDEEQRRADLSNTQWALEALKFSEFVESAPEKVRAGDAEEAGAALHWDKAINFLTRCQNLSTNPDKPKENDGGFFYRPGESKAGTTATGGLRSYGGMTYAGLKSMVYARMKKDDPRVRAAWQWISEHYTVDENPGLGKQGLFYYYQTFAKALHVYGEESLVDADGNRHDWRKDIVNKLVSLQHGDGYWVNENGRWWENIPELVTAYCVLTLEVANAGW